MLKAWPKVKKKYNYFKKEQTFQSFLQSLMVFLPNSYVFKENHLSSHGSQTPAKVPKEFDYETRNLSFLMYILLNQNKQQANLKHHFEALTKNNIYLIFKSFRLFHHLLQTQTWI